MRVTKLSIAVLGAILGCVLYVLPAQAQASRTWVSGVGDDVNPCSRTAPCKTFAGAISKTADKGEINCLDSGGFGALTITKNIAIKCEGVIGGVLAAGVNGITINSATAKVILEGLDINGFGTGINGINILAASKVFVIRTQIFGFTQNGINMTSTSGHLFLNNSFILNNGQAAGAFGGVNVAGTSNIGSITNTSILTNGNGASGFAVNASTASAIIGVETSILNDSVNAISRIAGAQVISVGPSNLLEGAGSFTSTTLFQ